MVPKLGLVESATLWSRGMRAGVLAEAGCVGRKGFSMPRSHRAHAGDGEGLEKAARWSRGVNCEHFQVLVASLLMAGEQEEDGGAWCPQVQDDVFGQSRRHGLRRGQAAYQCRIEGDGGARVGGGAGGEDLKAKAGFECETDLGYSKCIREAWRHRLFG